MAQREVTVEVTVQYVVQVIADNANEARKKAIRIVESGFATPGYIDEVILDVQPITTGKEV